MQDVDAAAGSRRLGRGTWGAIRSAPMTLARTTLALAALVLGLAASQRVVSAGPFEAVHPRVSAPWAAGTVPPNGPPSAAPTIAEWDAVKEVDVAKSTAYHCETKVVREWFRSTCTAYDKWTLLPPVCKQSSGDSCMTWLDPSGKGQKASVVQRLRRGQTYKITFAWSPGGAPYDLTIAVDAAGGATAGF